MKAAVLLALRVCGVNRIIHMAGRVKQWFAMAGDRGANNFVAGQQAAIVTYHAVGRVAANPLISKNVHNVVPDVFRVQIVTLGCGVQILPLETIMRRIVLGRSTSGLAALTFDDGYRSVFEHAIPLIEELRVPATLFVTTSLAEGKVFWRDKVRWVINEGHIERFLAFARQHDARFEGVSAENFYFATKDPAIISSRMVDEMLDRYFDNEGIEMASSGLYCTIDDLKRCESKYLTFGVHGHNHYVLSTLSREEQREDIVRSEEILDDAGIPRSRMFSVPNGGMRDINEDTLSVLRELGYAGYLMCAGYRACDIWDGKGVPQKDGDLWRLQRYMPKNEAPA